jgi:hypothetical protein
MEGRCIGALAATARLIRFGVLGMLVLFHIQPLETEPLLTSSSDASAVPASAVPLLAAFSPRASALSVAGAEAAPSASSLQEEACAAAGARSAEAFFAGERLGFASALAD